jgi:tetratricopeptide (TPR) repeat protein
MLVALGCAQYAGRSPVAHSIYVSAIESYRAGDYEAAVVGYTEVIRLNAEDAGALFNRGATYRMLEEFNNAESDLDRAIRLRPDFSLAYGQRALARLELGDCDGAREDVSAAVRFARDEQERSFADAVNDVVDLGSKKVNVETRKLK